QRPPQPAAVLAGRARRCVSPPPGDYSSTNSLMWLQNPGMMQHQQQQQFQQQQQMQQHLQQQQLGHVPADCLISYGGSRSLNPSPQQSPRPLQRCGSLSSLLDPSIELPNFSALDVQDVLCCAAHDQPEPPQSPQVSSQRPAAPQWAMFDPFAGLGESVLVDSLIDAPFPSGGSVLFGNPSLASCAQLTAPAFDTQLRRLDPVNLILPRPQVHAQGDLGGCFHQPMMLRCYRPSSIAGGGGGDTEGDGESTSSALSFPTSESRSYASATSAPLFAWRVGGGGVGYVCSEDGDAVAAAGVHRDRRAPAAAAAASSSSMQQSRSRNLSLDASFSRDLPCFHPTDRLTSFDQESSAAAAAAAVSSPATSAGGAVAAPLLKRPLSECPISRRLLIEPNKSQQQQQQPQATQQPPPPPTSVFVASSAASFFESQAPTPTPETPTQATVAAVASASADSVVLDLVATDIANTSAVAPPASKEAAVKSAASLIEDADATLLFCDHPACLTSAVAFPNAEQLREHQLNVHDYLFCDWPGCGRAFRSRKGLNRHVNCQHSKPLTCPLCSARYSGSRTHFERHLLHGHRRWMCPHAACTELFASKAERARHVADRHSNTPKAQLSCPLCPFTTNHQHALRRHTDCHSRRHDCAQCDRHFPSRRALASHQRMHLAAASLAETSSVNLAESPSSPDCPMADCPVVVNRRSLGGDYQSNGGDASAPCLSASGSCISGLTGSGGAPPMHRPTPRRLASEPCCCLSVGGGGGGGGGNRGASSASSPAAAVSADSSVQTPSPPSLQQQQQQQQPEQQQQLVYCCPVTDCPLSFDNLPDFKSHFADHLSGQVPGDVASLIGLPTGVGVDHTAGAADGACGANDGDDDVSSAAAAAAAAAFSLDDETTSLVAALDLMMASDQSLISAINDPDSELLNQMLLTSALTLPDAESGRLRCRRRGPGIGQLGSGSCGGACVQSSSSARTDAKANSSLAELVRRRRWLLRERVARLQGRDGSRNVGECLPIKYQEEDVEINCLSV
ncbi:hypothetical protein BOX15_Mlig015516g2, partial [Macrostomum lignano]